MLNFTVSKFLYASVSGNGVSNRPIDCSFCFVFCSVSSFEGCRTLIKDYVGPVDCILFDRLDKALAYVGWPTTASPSPSIQNAAAILPVAVAPLAAAPQAREDASLQLVATGLDASVTVALAPAAVCATTPPASPETLGIDPPGQSVGSHTVPRSSCGKRKLSSSWDENYEKLRLFMSRHGHCDVTPTTADGDKSFCTWVRYNRARCSKVQTWRRRKEAGEDVADIHLAIKDEAKADLLLALGVKWCTSLPTPNGEKRERSWEERFLQLKDYKEEHGNVKVSASRYPQLYSWTNHQSRNLGKESTPLSDYQRKRLLDLGVRPQDQDQKERPSLEEFSQKMDMRWEQRFQQLKDYKDEHGNVEVSVSKNPQLYSWINYQAANLGKETTGLSDERRKRLLDLGVKPRGQDHRKKRSFDDFFHQLLKFKEAYGHCDVPVQAKGKSDDWSSGLRNWVENLRDNFERYKRGESPLSCRTASLDPQRIAQLNKVGFRFKKVKRESFETRAADWLDYYTEHGRNPGHGDNEPDEHATKLAKWVTRTRRNYWRKQAGGKGGTLTDEWQDRLTSWGFDWNRKFEVPRLAERKTWDDHFLDLVEYKNKNGDVDVPQLYPVLGHWVHRQRRGYRQKKQGKPSSLTQERIEKLVKLGFKWITRKSPGAQNKAFHLDQAIERDFPRCEKHQPNGAMAASISAGNHRSDDYSSSEDDGDSSSDGALPTFSPTGRRYLGYNPPSWDRYCMGP